MSYGRNNRFIIKDKTTLFFKNKAEAFRKNYSIISANQGRGQFKMSYIYLAQRDTGEGI